MVLARSQILPVELRQVALESLCLRILIYNMCTEVPIL